VQCRFLFAKKGSILKCRYNAPWEVRDDSILFIDEKGKKKYEPTRNDDRLNVHNVDLLAMWRANVDCQPVVSRHVVLKYIAKYASKAEKRSESYQDMLTRISNSSGSEDPVCVHTEGSLQKHLLIVTLEHKKHVICY
jgi:hypothetical protein